MTYQKEKEREEKNGTNKSPFTPLAHFKQIPTLQLQLIN